MRVLCIDGVKPGTQGIMHNAAYGVTKTFSAYPGDEIYEGETYTVVDEENFNFEDYYQLAERRGNLMYKAVRFIPLTDSAEIIAEHEHEALIYQR